MNDFYMALNDANKIIYEPHGLKIESIQEEKQNAKYGAGIFQLSSKTVRFRVANRTPTKIGQFVALWEKDCNHTNQPYTFETSPDLFVITTFFNDKEFGQFIFPKEILVEKGILQSPSTKGKMAIRVYPIWDQPTSKQAKETQKWQLTYFLDMRPSNDVPFETIKDLYNL